MDSLVKFFGAWNYTIAVGAFAVLAVVTVVVMVFSEWKRGENWWRP